MSEWGWVIFGYLVTYGAIALYVGWLAWRVGRSRRRLRELSSGR